MVDIVIDNPGGGQAPESPKIELFHSELVQKMKDGFADDFFTIHFRNPQIKASEEEARRMTQAFPQWHRDLLRSMIDPLKPQYGPRVGIAQDLTFDDVASYPSRRLDKIETDIERLGNGPGRNILKDTRDYWKIRQQIAKRALEIREEAASPVK